MTHGEKRNDHIEVSVYVTPQFVGSSALTQTASERWCTNCQAWVRAAGIIGNIACRQCRTGW